MGRGRATQAWGAGNAKALRQEQPGLGRVMVADEAREAGPGPCKTSEAIGSGFYPGSHGKLLKGILSFNKLSVLE